MTDRLDFDEALRQMGACISARMWARDRGLKGAYTHCEKVQWMYWLIAKLWRAGCFGPRGVAADRCLQDHTRSHRIYKVLAALEWRQADGRSRPRLLRQVRDQVSYTVLRNAVNKWRATYGNG